MQVRPGRATGAARQCDTLTLLHRVTKARDEFAQMAIYRDEAVAVIDRLARDDAVQV
jgi:hypothetical protein